MFTVGFEYVNTSLICDCDVLPGCLDVFPTRVVTSATVSVLTGLIRVLIDIKLQVSVSFLYTHKGGN